MKEQLVLFMNNIMASMEKLPYWYWESLIYPFNYTTIVHDFEVQIEINPFKMTNEYIHQYMNFSCYTSEDKLIFLSHDTIIYKEKQ